MGKPCPQGVMGRVAGPHLLAWGLLTGFHEDAPGPAGHTVSPYTGPASAAFHSSSRRLLAPGSRLPPGSVEVVARRRRWRQTECGVAVRGAR